MPEKFAEVRNDRSFRHGLLRDAAYQLQLPGDRGRLHALAFQVIEGLAGGRPPDAPPLLGNGPSKLDPHSSDAFAAELADHASRAAGGDSAGPDSAALRTWPAVRRNYLRRAADHFTRTYRPMEGVAAWRNYADQVEGAERGEALNRAASTAHAAGHWELAERLYDESIRVFAAAKDLKHGNVAFGNRAGLYFDLGRIDRARRDQEEALAAARKLGESGSEGAQLTRLSSLYLLTGRLEQAAQASRRALRLHRELGDRRAEGTTLLGLGHMASQAGRYAESLEHHDQALSAFRQTGDLRSEGVALGSLGNLFWFMGDAGRAERAYDDALLIHRRVGNRKQEGVVLNNLAGLYQDTGRRALAEARLADALAIHREVGNRRSEGVTLGTLADLHRTTGRASESEAAFQAALAIHREIINLLFEGGDSLHYAMLLVSLGRIEEARSLATRGAALLAGVRAPRELERLTVELRAACDQAGIPMIIEVPAAPATS
jgi:tetratricopeptide (TPR) repeat protein